jgi:nitric oxide reductase activation protein
MRAVRIVFDEDATVYHSAEATFALYTALHDSYELVPFCRQNDVRALFPAREKLSIYPEVVGAHSPQLLARRPERTATITENAEGEQDIDLTSFGAADRESRRIRRALINGAYSVHSYPEFDYESGGYKRNHWTVYESTLPSGDPASYDHALKANMLVHKRVKKRFLALQPEEVSISRKWEDGEDIHIGDATDYATSLLMGRTVDEKVYIRKVTNRRDVTVAILLDASSSTAEPIADGTIIDMEKDALAILASALSTIGDRFAIFSYFSMGRSNVFVNVVKEFDDAWNREAQSRIDTVAAHAGNRDGAAIRHVTEKLKEEASKTRLMILLSDGIPADPGYGSGAGTDTNRYALEDTRRALTEQKREGITPFCVTIDRFARAYIPYLYGSYHYTVLDDIALLPERLSRVYLRLTR